MIHYTGSLTSQLRQSVHIPHLREKNIAHHAELYGQQADLLYEPLSLSIEYKGLIKTCTVLTRLQSDNAKHISF